MASVTMIVQLACQIREDRDASVFVSRCPSLDLYSQGETEEEAIEAIKSAIGMYLSAAFDHDRFEQTLRRAGFLEATMGPAPSDEFVAVAVADQKPREIPIEVPITLLTEHARNKPSPAAHT